MALSEQKSSDGKQTKTDLTGTINANYGKGRFEGHDGTTYRMFFGILPNGVWGFIIVKAGSDAENVFN